MNKYQLVGLSVTGGILSGIAWGDWCPGLILLISFVPFLIIEDHLYRFPERYRVTDYLVFILPGLIIFNILALGWIRAASIYSAIAVITGMSLLMSLTLWLAHVIRVKAGNTTGLTAFLVLWLAFEYLTLNSQQLTPWINLGNGLAKDILFIQWYEATGTAGGTLWILVSNLVLTLFVVNRPVLRGKRYPWLIIWIAIIAIPSAVSANLYYTIKEEVTSGSEILIVQPNIDPYTEKYKTPFEDQLVNVLRMAEENISDKTSWVITPETTIDDPVNENDPGNNYYTCKIEELSAIHPWISIVAGMVSYSNIDDTGPDSSDFLRETVHMGKSIEYYNSAFQIDTSDRINIYHKSKLVPGIEKHMLSGPGKLLNKILPDLGGTSWGYTPQKERECFIHPVTGQSAAPVICYESVFGEYVTGYVSKGADILFIITNDGWWKNTSGYKQHLDYASLRAIETRRPVARAANTGVSCIIDIRGKRMYETEWWSEAVIKGSTGSETRITYYVRHGDYLMRISSLLSVLILLYVFVALPFRKKMLNKF
jgi:apolipoprotein N-acyltransferase